MAVKRIWYRYDTMEFVDDVTKSISLDAGPNPKSEIVKEEFWVADGVKKVGVVIRFTVVE